MEDVYINVVLSGNRYCKNMDNVDENGTCLNMFRESVVNLSGVNLRELSVSNLQKLQELKQIKLPNAKLIKTIMPIKMQNAKMMMSDLTEADLNGVDLTGANLLRATLIGAKLIGANLTNTDLRNADLTNADLQGADLQGAELYDADLRGANLVGIRNMQTAKMGEETKFDKAQKRQLVALGVNISKIKPDHRIKSARPPVFKRTVSTNIPDQLETNYCWAYSMSKVIHRFFKSILVELKTVEGDNPSCDKFYSNHLFQSHQSTLNAELCGGVKEYKNLVLFMFIFNELTKMHGCDSGSRIIQMILYTDRFFEKFIKPDLQYSDLFSPVIDIHLRVVFELLKKISQLCNKDCFVIRYYIGLFSIDFSYDVLFTIIKDVIDQGLYLSLSMPLKNISNKLFEQIKNVEFETGHSLTVVGYNNDDKSITIKNSWGDRLKYLTILLDELKHEDNDIGIIWIAPPDELYFKSSKGSSEGAVRDSRSYNSSKDSINSRYPDNYNESSDDISLNLGFGLNKKMSRVKKSKNSKKSKKKYIKNKKNIKSKKSKKV
jgi:uncharacterized protein YjbI with pentapeptide repeats